MRFPIDQHDLRFGGKVGIDHRLGAGDLKRFRMGIQLGYVLQAFTGCGINDRNTPSFISTVGDIDTLFCRIVAHIIGVFSNLDRIQQLEGIAVVDPEFAIRAVGDEELIEFADISHTLGVRRTLDAVYVAAGKCIHNFHRVVAESGANYALALGIEGEVIDPALHLG